MVFDYSVKDIDDINQLGAILDPNFKKLFHIDNLRPNEKIYVYKDNSNNILGFIHISIIYEVSDIINIVVNSLYQNKRIGTNLLDYMISHLPSTANRVMLEVRENNLQAINFYKKHNFKIINIRKNYYDNENALIMEKDLKKEGAK